MSSGFEFPVDAFEDQIVSSLGGHQVIVVAADTGAGKSTRVAMMLHRAGYAADGMIGVTEPRRVAAIALSEYVAEKNGGECGGVVGFQIGGVRKLSRDTRVKYMTEGILLRELHGNPSLGRSKRHPGYSVIIADEVHERGVNQDLILALMKDVLKRRPDLKLVVMSATIDEQRFSDHFDGAPIIKVPGRMHPVEVRWEDSDAFNGNVDGRVSDKICQILDTGERGDILAFMPDEKSIKRVCQLVEERVSRSIKVLPLYGNQAPEDQKEALRRRPERRVIVATNIAETSLTIDGVVHVVDSGLIKQVQYVSATMSALEVCEHSKAGCEQRKGRAGRTQSGICHRMYTQHSYNERDGFTRPEILRQSLDGVLLHLRCLDYSMDDILSLPLMDKPGDDRWREAENLLTVLGALDAESQVTDSGRVMEQLAMAPMLAKMVLAAQEFGCTDQIATIAAGLVSRPVFVRPKGHEEAAQASARGFMDMKSDGHTLLKVYAAWSKACEEEAEPYQWARDKYLSSRALREIDRNREQILGTLARHGIPLSTTSDKVAIEKAVASGLLYNLCVLKRQNSYVCGDRDDVVIYPGSSVFPPHHRDFSGSIPNPELMVCAELWQTSKTFARGCTVIRKEWLAELLPESSRQMTYEFRSSFTGFGIHPQVVRQISWNNVKLAEEFVETFGPEAIAGITLSITQGAVQLYSFADPLHPSMFHINAVYRTLTTAWREYLGSSFLTPQHVRDHLSASIAIAIGVQLAGCTTVDEVLARSIELVPDVHLPEEIRDEVMPRVRRILVEEQAKAERSAREREVAQRRAEVEKAERAVTLGPLRERIDRLVETRDELRAQGGDVSAFSWRIDSASRSCGQSYTHVPTLRSDVGSLEREVDRARKITQRGTELTEMAWSSVIDDRFGGVCPLCGGSFEESADMVVCTNSHDLNRVLPHRDAGTSSARDMMILQIATNNDDVVGKVCVNSGMLYVSAHQRRGSVWKSKKFKSVHLVDHCVILPAELADERDDILEVLQELKEAEDTLRAIMERVQALRKRAKYGDVVKLQFSIIGGQAQCRSGGKLYRSKFVENYPARGETWYCIVTGESYAEGGSFVHEVVPEVKVSSSITDESDIEELREVIRETFPGLPAQLLH